MTKYTILAILALPCLGCGGPPAWKYTGQFHTAIAAADRVVVYDDGFDPYGNDSKAKILFEISKPDEIKQLAENLQFQKSQKLDSCPCIGYPRIDWYQGKERLAFVSVQHCKAIRWKQFQADALLTSKSGQWIHQWLSDHGVDPTKMK
jgi:hypothetical protein